MAGPARGAGRESRSLSASTDSLTLICVPVCCASASTVRTRHPRGSFQNAQSPLEKLEYRQSVHDNLGRLRLNPFHAIPDDITNDYVRDKSARDFAAHPHLSPTVDLRCHSCRYSTLSPLLVTVLKRGNTFPPNDRCVIVIFIFDRPFVLERRP